MADIEVNGKKFWVEIMKAIQDGVEKTANTIIENTTQLEFRTVLLKTGILYEMNIKEAVNNAFKKYTESEKDNG